MDPDMIEKLAEANHEVWMRGKVDAGWVFDPTTDKDAKKHSSLTAYAHLCEADKQSNRDSVIGIPVILEKAGLCIVSAEWFDKQTT